MKYRNDRKGNKISQLGYGCMRFSKIGNAIDYKKAEKEILYAYQKGINYYDTAYVYPGSEETLGKILANNNIRDKVYIASKLPQYLMRTSSAIENTFQEELKRLDYRMTWEDDFLKYIKNRIWYGRARKSLAYKNNSENYIIDWSISFIKFIWLFW